MGPCKRPAAETTNGEKELWASVKIQNGRIIGKHGKAWRTVKVPRGWNMEHAIDYIRSKDKFKHVKRPDEIMHINPDPNGYDIWTVADGEHTAALAYGHNADLEERRSMEARMRRIRDQRSNKA